MKAVEFTKLQGYSTTELVDPTIAEVTANLRHLRDNGDDAASVMVCIMTHGQKEAYNSKVTPHHTHMTHTHIHKYILPTQQGRSLWRLQLAIGINYPTSPSQMAR